MDDYRDLPGEPRRSVRLDRLNEGTAERSNAAIPVAIVLVAVGLFLGMYSLLVPAVLGLVLLLTGMSFVSSRLNPLSIHFYLNRKPSWAAIGAVFLGALALLLEAYELWVRGGVGRLVPHL